MLEGRWHSPSPSLKDSQATRLARARRWAVEGRWAGEVFFSQPVSWCLTALGNPTAGSPGQPGAGRGALISPWATFPGSPSRPARSPRVTEATGRRGLPLTSPGQGDSGGKGQSRARASRAKASSSPRPPLPPPCLPFRKASPKTWQGGLPSRPCH